MCPPLALRQETSAFSCRSARGRAEPDQLRPARRTTRTGVSRVDRVNTSASCSRERGAARRAPASRLEARCRTCRSPVSSITGWPTNSSRPCAKSSMVVAVRRRGLWSEDDRATQSLETAIRGNTSNATGAEAGEHRRRRRRPRPRPACDVPGSARRSGQHEHVDRPGLASDRDREVPVEALLNEAIDRGPALGCRQIEPRVVALRSRDRQAARPVDRPRDTPRQSALSA